jgi:hypothetical protein
LIAGSNAANQVIDNSASQWDGSSIYIWSGVSFNLYLIDSGVPSGYTDAGGNPVPAPIIAPGTGFLFNNQTAPGPLTFVGQVTGVVTNDPHLIADIILPATPLFNFVSSPIPIGGGIYTALQMPSDGTLDGDSVQLVAGAGNAITLTPVLFDSGSPTGFTDVGGNPVPEPVIPVATGFFFVNANAVQVPWHQDIDLGP